MLIQLSNARDNIAIAISEEGKIQVHRYISDWLLTSSRDVESDSIAMQATKSGAIETLRARLHPACSN